VGADVWGGRKSPNHGSLPIRLEANPDHRARSRCHHFGPGHKIQRQGTQGDQVGSLKEKMGRQVAGPGQGRDPS
jgi:hypothetical protein